MFARRTLMRTAQALRCPSSRAAFQKRLVTTIEDAMKNAQDNAFNRERQAVRDHAAATAGLWYKLSLYGIPPALILAGINAWIRWKEHWEHWDHMPPLEERVEYPYQNIRKKNFCWGDGDKTLFWNPKVNYHKQEE